MHILKRVKTAIPYIALMAMILVNYSGYYLFSGKITKEAVMFIPLGIVLVMVMLELMKKRTINFRQKSFVVLIFLSLNVLISSLIDKVTFSPEVLMLISALIVAQFVTSIYGTEKIINIYTNLIFALAIYSLVTTYVLLPAYMAGLFRNLPTFSIKENSYLDFYFSTALMTFGVSRNCGFCREPGVYQFFLLIAVYFIIEKRDKSTKSAIMAIIIIFTMLTTFSAVAYITSVIAIIMLIKKHTKDLKNGLGILCLIIFACIGVYLLLNSNANIYNEFSRTFGKWKFDSESESLQVRLSGITSNMTLFLEKPIFGYGLVTSWKEIIQRYGYVDVTGTTFIGFSAFGIFFGIVIHYLMLKACSCRQPENTWIWFVALTFSCASQNLIISNILWVFLFTGISNIDYVRNDNIAKSRKDITVHAET